VTTRGRNLDVFNGLRHKFGLPTALLLCLSALGSHTDILPTFGLAPCRLPAVNLTQALRLLAVALNPAPWLVLTLASLAQIASRARLGVLWRNDCAFSYPGRCPREVLAPKRKPGGMCHHSPLGRYQNANKTLNKAVYPLLENETKN
jgi:hypothetical protein